MIALDTPKWTDIVQAGCAIGGLIGLVAYVIPTIGILRETLKQNEASRKPLFDFQFVHNTTSGTILRAVNIGTGPALNLRAHRGDGERIYFSSTDPFVIVGEHVVLSQGTRFDVEYRFAAHDGFRIEYSDLAGKRYWSTFRNTPVAKGERRKEHYLYQHGAMPKESFSQRLDRWGKSFEEE